MPDLVDHYVSTPPAGRLCGRVVRMTGWAQAGVPPGEHRGLPSPWLTFIITLDDRLVVSAHPDPVQRADRYDALLAGLHTSPAVITHEGRQSGIQVAVHPLAAPSLLGVPAGELAGRDEHAADVLGPWVDRVQDRMRAATDWRGRFSAFTDELAGRPCGGLGAVPELRRAWTLLVRGDVAVAAVATEVGWSVRRLHARCRSEIGLGPQELRRVARFDRARRAVAAGRAPAAVAADHGYADQAHLTHEFTRFAGLPPRRWLSAERRSGQDAAVLAATGSVA